MKLSTSSSFFLATLALSSSASTLAAPAGDATDSVLSVSPSNNDMFDSFVHPVPHCSGHRVQSQPTPAEDKAQAIVARSATTIQDLIPLLATTPVLGPLLASLLAGISARDLSAQDVATIEATIQGLIQQLNAKSLSPVKSDLPVAQKDFVPAAELSTTATASTMSSTQAASTPSAVVNDVSSYSSTSTTPPSPPFPTNPPNTPSMPIHLP